MAVRGPMAFLSLLHLELNTRSLRTFDDLADCFVDVRKSIAPHADYAKLLTLSGDRRIEAVAVGYSERRGHAARSVTITFHGEWACS